MTALDIHSAEGFDLCPMTEHDLLDVVELEESCGLSRWGWDGYHAELAAGSSTLMHVARAPSGESRRIAGFIAARVAAGELHINNVAVSERYRRKGVGGALLSLVLEQARRKGAGRAFLEVRASNLPAQALYARHGFQVVGRRPRYYSNPPEDALVMALVL